MKKRLPNIFLFLFLLLSSATELRAQCPAGYNQAHLNWDNLDYYYNSGLNIAPYGYSSGGSKTYVSNAMEQSQRFALGPNSLSIVTSAAGMVKGENGTHTGNIANYTGDDAEFNPTANGQNIVITFATPVRNANFTLYDVDKNAVMTVTAADASNAALTVTATLQSPTILTVAGTPGKTISDLTNTTLGNTDNRGTVTINVAGTAAQPVKSITITCTAIGGNPGFWLSDIYACVTGSFPNNYHQGLNNQPFTGPTQNQPDYFIVTPDNNSVYMMDAATAKCYYLFTDAARTYVNSFAYDAVNKYLYYISENTSLDLNNKALKRYDFNTSSTSTVLADVTATLNFPTFNAGVESAAAAFYNGQLYLGIEGGQYSSGNTRESIVWRIDFDASQNPIYACQVMGTDSYDNTGNIIHDWADILVKDGTLISYNSAKVGSSYANSSYTHFDMFTSGTTRHNNPSPGQKYSGQAGLSWAGNMYMIYDSLWQYNAGVISNKIKMVVVNPPGEPVGPAWVGNAGDGSDPFRPMCDFGDAPATYDPNPVSPAVHERSEFIRLGPTWDKEWLKRGVTGNNDVDDGITFVPVLPPGASSRYLASVSVYNNSGSNATLIAWLDYNGNGVFDASEAITPITVPSSASNQSFYLYWPSSANTFSNGTFTYLRVRITSASAGMTTSHATGYFTNGEVEDYRVLVDNFPLSVNLFSFNAALQPNKKVKLNWSASEDPELVAYEIERSSDSRNWQHVDFVDATTGGGQQNYEAWDNQPLLGTSYYRLKMAGSGQVKYSEIRTIIYNLSSTDVLITPNPAYESARVRLQRTNPAEAKIHVMNAQGATIYRTSVIVNGSSFVDLPVSQWPVGTYIVQVVTNNEVVNQKLVVK